MTPNSSRKGTSNLIFTLLLMVLAVSAGVVIYAYTVGYIGGFREPPKLGAITVETWSLDPTRGLTTHIRNIGKATFDLDSVYINGEQVAKKGELPLLLAEGEVHELVIGYDNEAGNSKYPWAPSKTYEVKLIGLDQTQLVFQVKSNST